jgi:hypothetical protein
MYCTKNGNKEEQKKETAWIACLVLAGLGWGVVRSATAPQMQPWEGAHQQSPACRQPQQGLVPLGAKLEALAQVTTFDCPSHSSRATVPARSLVELEGSLAYDLTCTIQYVPEIVVVAIWF